VAMEVADVAEVDALESVDESAGTDGEVA
jgi:hypothetical protein